MVDHGLAVRISEQEGGDAQVEREPSVDEWPEYDESDLPDPFAKAPKWGDELGG